MSNGIASFIIIYGIDEDLSVLTSSGGLHVYPLQTTGRPTETCLLKVLGLGDYEVLALLTVISDLVLFIVSNVRHSKDIGDTLGVTPHAPIAREVSNLIDKDGVGVVAEV